MHVRSRLVATELVSFHHCGRGTGELGVWNGYINLRHEGGGEETHLIHLRRKEGEGKGERKEGRKEGGREEGRKEGKGERKEGRKEGERRRERA